jgi:hypothetical protein
MLPFLLKRILAVSVIYFFAFSTKANDTTAIKVLTRYESALLALQQLLSSPKPTSFKEAVLITENAYLNNLIEKDAYQQKITKLAAVVSLWVQSNSNHTYKYTDSLNFETNFGIFQLMKRSIKIISPDAKDTFQTKPFDYDFDDFLGRKEWANTFVTTLFYTYKGNCHSLPYLYKILADELGATCWLSFAPNHIYIKNRCLKDGWYNTELTSGEFPIDAWIATSGYVPIDAIRNGIYMDTLSNQQAIALCALDLAKGYEFQTKNYDDSFILKCCDLTLKYHPLNVQAILLKAETLKHIYEKQNVEKRKEVQTTYAEMEKQYIRLFELGYREMPEKMYMQWLQSVVKQRSKYGNKKIKTNNERM